MTLRASNALISRFPTFRRPTKATRFWPLGVEFPASQWATAGALTPTNRPRVIWLRPRRFLRLWTNRGDSRAAFAWSSDTVGTGGAAFIMRSQPAALWRSLVNHGCASRTFRRRRKTSRRSGRTPCRTCFRASGPLAQSPPSSRLRASPPSLSSPMPGQRTRRAFTPTSRSPGLADDRESERPKTVVDPTGIPETVCPPIEHDPQTTVTLEDASQLGVSGVLVSRDHHEPPGGGLTLTPCPLSCRWHRGARPSLSPHDGAVDQFTYSSVMVPSSFSITR